MKKKTKELERLYFTTLLDVAKPRSPERPEDRASRLSRLQTVTGQLAEALLFSDQLVLNVNGINLELPLLIELFGFKTICTLLENDVIHFAFCPGVVSYLTADKVRSLGFSSPPGMHRLLGVGVAWSDPFESAELALREQTNLKRDDRRLLSRLVSRNSKVLPGDKIFHEGVRLANADIRSELGKQLGFAQDDIPERGDFIGNKEINFRDLTHFNMLYLSMVMSKCTDTVSKELAYRVLQNRVVVEPRFKHQVKIIDNILQFEDVPDVQELVSSGRLGLKSVLEIRDSKHLQEFRQWLKTLPSKEGEIEVLRAYCRAVEDKLSNKTLYKLLKLGVFTATGTAIGSMIGPAGTVLGGITGIATDFALGFTDTFFVDQLVDGWNPKIFIEKEIKSRLQ
ncbi:MAG: hypothetical protein HY960_16050 [Ignavibacteriae bacterium]|nr:hypothetical protein [Ignavibacteriota bacterium]